MISVPLFAARSVSRLLFLTCFLHSPTRGEAIFFPDEPQGVYAEAEDYSPVLDPMGVLAEVLGLSKVGSDPVLTVDPVSGEYTYWYTQEGRRVSETFFLPSRVRGALSVTVSAEKDSYVYHYRFLPDNEKSVVWLRNIVLIMGTEDYQVEDWGSFGFRYGIFKALDNTPRLLVSRWGEPGDRKPIVQFTITSPAPPAIIRANAMTFEEPPPIPGGSIGLEGASAVTRTVGPGIVTYGSLQEMFSRVRPIAARYGWASDDQLAALAVLVEDRALDDAERLQAFRARCESMGLSELAALSMSVVTS